MTGIVIPKQVGDITTYSINEDGCDRMAQYLADNPSFVVYSDEYIQVISVSDKTIILVKKQDIAEPIISQLLTEYAKRLSGK